MTVSYTENKEGIATDGRENKAACVKFLERVHQRSAPHSAN